MMQGFFKTSEITTSLKQTTIAKCGQCGLHRSCQSPKMPISGDGERGILIVGEAPGENEDRVNRPFVGAAGQELRQQLRRNGIEPDRDCWITNAIICRPKDNATPSPSQIGACRANLMKAIKELQPHLIIPLGYVAVKGLIPLLWKDDVSGVTEWAGWKIPAQKFNVWVCPTYHPSFLMRIREKNATPDLLFSKHIEEAVRLEDRPWDKAPDFESRVRRIYDHEEARYAIAELNEECNGRTIAFDYETNMLKPESSEARIVSCSISNGDTTIAYPMVGGTIKATKQILRNPTVKKWAHNMKFEDRWSRAILGCEVRGWDYCSMVGAHWLDCRRGITSLKFQSFVRLGMPAYDDHISHLLKGPPNKPNRIDEISLRDLLLYNGLDSLLEFLVAEHQRKELDRC